MEGFSQCRNAEAKHKRNHYNARIARQGYTNFDGGKDLEVAYFLIYVENYFPPRKSEEEKAAVVVTHLRGMECRWFYEKVSERGKLMA